MLPLLTSKKSSDGLMPVFVPTYAAPSLARSDLGPARAWPWGWGPGAFRNCCSGWSSSCTARSRRHEGFQISGTADALHWLASTVIRKPLSRHGQAQRIAQLLCCNMTFSVKSTLESYNLRQAGRRIFQHFSSPILSGVATLSSPNNSSLLSTQCTAASCSGQTPLTQRAIFSSFM